MELVRLDLADLDSVRRAAAEVLDLVPALDLLVNNAGVMAPPLSRTAQGFELQLGTNHLGHFLLTRLLEPALKAAAPSRVVNVSSRGHLRGGLHFDDPHWRTRDYDKWTAYGQSKTANVLFTVELEKRWGADGVHAYALHPGVIPTELSRHLTQDDFQALSTQGRGGSGGLYLEDCAVGGPTPGDGSAGYAPHAVDPEAAARLWEWSEREVGL